MEYREVGHEWPQGSLQFLVGLEHGSDAVQADDVAGAPRLCFCPKPCPPPFDGRKVRQHFWCTVPVLCKSQVNTMQQNNRQS